MQVLVSEHLNAGVTLEVVEVLAVSMLGDCPVKATLAGRLH